LSVLLYDNPVSGNCFKVRAILALLGIDFERHEISVVDYGERLKTLGGLSPTLNIPTVVLEDGRPLAESNAILWYFAERSPYLPEDAYERGQVLQWLFFEQYKHEPGIAVPRFWDTIAGDDLTPPADLELRRASGREALKVMERHLRDRSYFVGTCFSVADIALYDYTQVAPEGGFDLEPLPAVRAWLDRVAAEPGLISIDD